MIKLDHRLEKPVVINDKDIISANSLIEVSLRGDLDEALVFMKEQAKTQNVIFEMQLNGVIITIHAHSKLKQLRNMVLYGNTWGDQ